MRLTQLQAEESVNELPFQDLINQNLTDSVTYLIKHQERIIGFVEVEQLEEGTYKLTKFVVTKLDHSEQLIEIFYHILEKVDRSDVDHLLVETKEEPLIELLNLLGFKRWTTEKDTLGYSYS